MAQLLISLGAKVGLLDNLGQGPSLALAMKPVRLAALISGLLLLFTLAAWIMVLSLKNSRLQDENLGLKAALEPLQKIPKEAEPVPEAARQTVASEKPGETYEIAEKEHRELLRLRNEVSGLRRENQEMKSARIADLNKKVINQIDKAFRLSEGAHVGAWLGIGIRAAAEVTDSNMKEGVIVTEVMPGGPSQDRLVSGDIILSLDGMTLTGVEHFKNIVRAKNAGSPALLSIYRGNERREVEVIPGHWTAQTTRSNPYE